MVYRDHKIRAKMLSIALGVQIELMPGESEELQYKSSILLVDLVCSYTSVLAASQLYMYAFEAIEQAQLVDVAAWLQ